MKEPTSRDEPRRRRVAVGHMPDPARAHGAWVYLVVSVAAGVLTEVGDGVVPALLAGVGFAGAFLCASALALGQRRRARLVLGLFLAAAAPGVSLVLGADPAFLAFGLVAIFPAALSGYFAERQGFHSAGALGFAVTALVVAAPSCACAGGATPSRSWLLMVLLAPFFGWRTWKLRREILEGERLSRAVLRRRGWREALNAVLWTAFSLLLIHVLA